jgi:predicted DNA-binding protein
MPRSLNPKPKPNTKRITAHIHVSMVEKLESESKRTRQNVSWIIREALDKYFSIEAKKEDTEFFAGVVRPIVKEEIGKQANRLAAMLFKIGIISAGNYFMAARTLSDVISPSMQEDFKDINANARKLGIDYMKQNGVGVVEFLEDTEAVERAAEKLKTDYTQF